MLVVIIILLPLHTITTYNYILLLLLRLLLLLLFTVYFLGGLPLALQIHLSNYYYTLSTLYTYDAILHALSYVITLSIIKSCCAVY